RPTPILTRHHHRASTQHGGNETLELATQRIRTIAHDGDAFDDILQRTGLERRAWAEGHTVSQPKELTGPRGQIQAQVPRALEDPQLPHPIQRYTARREVRHAATLELQPGVGDIRTRRKDWNPDGR